MFILEQFQIIFYVILMLYIIVIFNEMNHNQKILNEQVYFIFKDLVIILLNLYHNSLILEFYMYLMMYMYSFKYVLQLKFLNIIINLHMKINIIHPYEIT